MNRQNDTHDTHLVGGLDTFVSELKRSGSECEACLIVVRGRQQGKRYELTSPTMSMGRDGTSDIVIEDPTVSRKQATFQKDDSTVWLVDGGSRNGTFINGQQISTGDTVILNKEDIIKVGDTVLKYLPKGALEIRYISMLESKAYTDALTQAYNKGYILEAMEAEFNRAKALGGELSLLVIDLDHFKRVNDTHGHDAGDYVLVEVSNILRIATFARRGILGRFGGEEFVALLPAQSRSSALELAEFIRESVERHAFSYDSMPIRMTASIGVAAVAGEIREAKELFKLADKAVYLAKNGGRNRVCYCPV